MITKEQPQPTENKPDEIVATITSLRELTIEQQLALVDALAKGGGPED